MTIRKNQLLHWIWTKSINKAVEIVKKLTQTVFGLLHINYAKTEQIIFEWMTIRKNQILHWIWKKSFNLRP